MRFEILPDAQGEHRWRAVADNGEIVAQSEGYTRKTDAKRAARDFALEIVKQVTSQDWSDLDIEARIRIEDVDE